MDIDQIKALIELMSENALTEVMIRDGDSRVLLRRGPTGEVTTSLPIPNPAGAPAAAPTPAAAPAAAEPKLLEIKAPMVGTFYTAPDPDSPPYVRVGSSIESDSVVCLIEAMKVFNEIKAEVSGTIERLVADSGGPVEYGQVLFQVRPHA